MVGGGTVADGDTSDTPSKRTVACEGRAGVRRGKFEGAMSCLPTIATAEGG